MAIIMKACNGNNIYVTGMWRDINVCRHAGETANDHETISYDNTGKIIK